MLGGLWLGSLMLIGNPVVPSPAAASASDEYEEVDVLDVADCPAIFGPDPIHASNQRYRQPRLHGFAITDERVEITHSVGRWTTPGLMRLTGLSLLGVERVDAAEKPSLTDEQAANDAAEDHAAKGTPAKSAASGQEHVALMELDQEQTLCPPGVYGVGIDDALGQHNRVLGIDARGVLVEQDGMLAFLPWEGHPVPTSTRMVWRSSYDVELTGSGSSSKSAKKSKSRKKPKKKKAKRKKKKSKRK